MNSEGKVQEGCPFCLSNGLFKSEIIAQNNSAYLTESMSDKGDYLVIPKTHAESLAELPDSWWKETAAMIGEVPVKLDDYNLSFNIGKLSGQTVKHLHLWIIPRYSGKKSSGMGMASLINRVDSF